MNNRAEIIKDILNEYYDDFDYRSYNGDAEVEVTVYFYIEKALKKCVKDLNINTSVKNIIKHIFEKVQDWCKLAETKEGLVLIFETFDKVVNLRDAEEYDDVYTEKIYEYINDIINIETSADEKEILNLLKEYFETDEIKDCVEIEIEGDLEEIAREAHEELESIRRSDEEDYWSWRRS
jgi:metal-responsive CopG/Arc/MetJ family transcriptional regulator